MIARAMVVVLFLACSISARGTLARDISSITYRFTPCGTTGRLGPATDLQCISYHQNQSTPVARDNVLIPQTTPHFAGAQLARIPRTTLYNITLAGASGGRGLCSNVSGQGIVIRAQAELNKDFRLLILVGQRGMGPCSFTKTELESICSSLAENDFEKCNDTWWNYLHSIATLNDGLDMYQHVGGGGGGGASMIRLENDDGLQIFPLIVAGGGGGGASLLDFDILEDVNFTRPPNATREEIYQAFVDAKREDFDLVLSDFRTQRGFVAPQLFGERTAGAGGGYTSGEEELRRVDGSQLILEDAFGEGGVDCCTSSLVPTFSTSEVGGFGVGGGGCGGGGGGGGQTGGAIVGGGNLYPGGGGYSFVRNGVEVLDYAWNDGDGFVEIVPADCGCSFECQIEAIEKKFECLCPETAKLAPDMSDCYQFTSRPVRHRNLLRDSSTPLVITIADFGSSVRLYSITVILTALSPITINKGGSGSGYSSVLLNGDSGSDGRQEKDLLCVIVFVSENNELVLASNLAQSGTNELTMLQPIVVDFNTGSVSVEGEPMMFLSSPMAIKSALLISHGDCFVKGELHMNTSIVESSDSEGSGDFNRSLEEEILSNPELAAMLLRLLRNNTIPFNNVAPILMIWQIALIAVGGTIVLVSLLLVICTTVICCHKHKNKKWKKKFYSMSVPSSIASSLSNNPAYISHGHSVFPHTNYHKYTNEGPQSCFEMDHSVRYGCSPTPRSQFGLNEAEESTFSIDHNFSTYNRARSKSTLRHLQWQFPRNKLIYMRELGEGQFGKVLLMKAENGIAGYTGNIAVAVKTLTSRDPETVAKFMEEAELMKKFSHPNIVSLLGVSTSDVVDDDNAPLIILEYMAYGDLHAFLVQNRPGSLTRTVNLYEENFISFARDVAEALKFMAMMRYVHRDIAARNCLVGGGLRIKISDFGLARKLNSRDYYSLEESSVLPIRSMAPEIFLTGRYSTASDVWSYGVLVWEIVSYGESPLPGLSSRDIAELAQSGQLQHIAPSDCPDLLSSVMSRCHSNNPSLRPSFTDIIKLLTQQHTIYLH